MKYNDANKPLVCMLSEGACYKGTKRMDVWGVLWHSTGANNPTIKRYVQPADNDPNKENLLALLGVNKNKNDYNHGNTKRQMGVNAWIGQLADGTVATVQTMPWDYAPWGCGAGSKGSCNQHWIQFEICEDGLADAEYACAVYEEACQLTAYLCRMFNIDPTASVQFKGVTVPTILDHKTSHALNLGNNHGDIAHWFPKIINKTLDDIRSDVARIMAESGEEIQYAPAPIQQQPVPEDIISTLGSRLLRRGMTGSDVMDLQALLITAGYNLGSAGADGIFGAKTQDAVLSFQQKAGLDVDGIVGPQTLLALAAVASNEAMLKQEPEYCLIINGEKETLQALQTQLGGRIVEAGKVTIA